MKSNDSAPCLSHTPFKYQSNVLFNFNAAFVQAHDLHHKLNEMACFAQLNNQRKFS